MKSNLSLIPASYFGPISHYHALECCNTQIEINESYQKRSVRNRCNILGPNGIQTLTVPLKKGKNLSSISEVLISYDEDWCTNHLRSLKTAYSTSPYYEYYIDKIQTLYRKDYVKLLDLDLAITELMTTVLGLDAIQLTSTFQHPKQFSGYDFRTKKEIFEFNMPSYSQVFEDKFGFVSNLSILDLLFNAGPESKAILKRSSITFYNSSV